MQWKKWALIRIKEVKEVLKLKYNLPLTVGIHQLHDWTFLLSFLFLSSFWCFWPVP